MRAAVLRRQGGELSIEDVTIADPKAAEVRVRIVATGVCHSDLTVIRGRVPVGVPMVPGHEAAGIVEAVGDAVARVKPGDRVALSWAPNCGSCYYCVRSHPTLCDVYGEAAGHGVLWDGTSRLGGGAIFHYSCISSFAEQAVVPEAACVALPDDVPFAIGALVGCAVTTGFGAVMNDAQVGPGDSVAVVGVGGVGVNALQAAVVAGAETIVAVDIDPTKAEQARLFGATHVIDGRAPDAAEQVRALTRGRGVDRTVECTGHPSAMRLAYDATRSAGRIVIVGIAPGGTELSIPATGFPGSKKQITGSIYGGGVPQADMARIFDLYLEGRLDIDRQVGARIGLDRVNDALKWMETGTLGRTIIEFPPLG